LTYVSIAFLLLGNIAVTALALIAVAALPFLYWLFVVRPENKRLEKPLKAAHYWGVFLLLVYVMLVYRRTGIPSINYLISTMNSERALIPPDSIHLIPFASFADGFHGFLFFGLNVLMTIPLGFLLATLWPYFRSVKRIAVVGFCFSLAIELSQLFTNRGTNVDDLIANTLGAVLGYVLFVFVYRLWIRKRSERRKVLAEKRGQILLSSKVLKSEGIVYLAASFLGMFLLFNPAWVSQFDMGVSIPGVGSVIQETTNRNYVKGTVVEVGENSLIIELIELDSDEEGENLFATSNTQESEIAIIHFNEATTIDIWRIDASQTAFPVASDVDPSDIQIGDMVDIHFAVDYLNYQLGINEIDLTQPAQYIIVWRFS